MKKGLIVGAVIALGIVIFFGVRMVGQSPQPPEAMPAVGGPVMQQPAAKPVTTAVPQRQRLAESLTVHGKLESASRVDVMPKAAGQITAVNVRVGDQVSAGDVLLQIETNELELRVQQARAALEAAQANLQRVVEGARPEEVKQAEAALAQAAANFVNTALVYERSKKLFESGVLAAKDWDAVQAQFEVAQAQRLSAEKSLDLIKKGARESDIAATKAQVRQAEVALKSAELQLSYAAVKAPISGTIASASVEVGGTAGGAPVATILDLSTLEIDLRVGEREIVLLEPGQSVRVVVDVLPNQVFEGIVDTVSPAADPVTGLFGVKVKVDNSDGTLKSGMYASASIVVSAKDDALAIPERAVVTKDGTSSVYVVEDGKAKLSPIVRGIVGDGMVEVLDGLTEESVVIISGHEFLSAGDTVRLIERGEAQ